MKKKILCFALLYIFLFGCTPEVNEADVSIKTATILVENQNKYVVYQDENFDTIQKKIPSDILVIDSSTTSTFDVLTDGEHVLLSMIDDKIKVIQINYE